MEIYVASAATEAKEANLYAPNIVIDNKLNTDNLRYDNDDLW